MKKLLVLLSLFFSLLSFTQSKEGEIIEANSETEKISKTIPFTIVERAPSHPNCVDKSTQREKRKCMNSMITKHIREHFKPTKKMYKYRENVRDEKTGKIIESRKVKLNSGRYRIKVKFKIGTIGEIEDIEVVDAPTHKLALEAKRAVSLLPKMEPGMQKGKPVRVGYFLPINFIIN